jgi:hypothetical protein
VKWLDDFYHKRGCRDPMVVSKAIEVGGYFYQVWECMIAAYIGGRENQSELSAAKQRIEELELEKFADASIIKELRVELSMTKSLQGKIAEDAFEQGAETMYRVLDSNFNVDNTEYSNRKAKYLTQFKHKIVKTMNKVVPRKKMDKRPVPKEAWTKERYEQQIASVESDIRDFSAKITDCDKRISHVMHEKKMFMAQESKKARYLNQLKKDLENLIEGWTVTPTTP